MSKLSYHINHNTFPIQTHQNCVTLFAYDLYMVSTISITTLFLHKHVKIASHHLYVVSTISITTPLLYKHVRIILPYQSLRFSYTNMSKSSYTMCIQCPPYQSLHLSFLYKHVKITSHFPSVHYINHCTFPTQTCQNCITPLVYGGHHISHNTFLYKLRPLHIS